MCLSELVVEKESQLSTMGQYFMFVNATKCQKLVFCLKKACEIMEDSDFQSMLALLLLHMGHGMADQADTENITVERVPSLQTLSLRFLGDHEKQYLPFDQYLPNHMIKSIGEAYLTGNSVGAWCGDRIILTGDYSDWTPFKPKAEATNMYYYADKMYPESPDFNNIRSAFFGELYEGLITKLEASSVSNKNYIVMNLDKHEYLDPRHYPAGEKTILDIINNPKRNGVMLGLLICLTHSTGAGFGDLSARMQSKGVWGGDRIVICTKEEVKDFHLYQDVSNHQDIEYMD